MTLLGRVPRSRNGPQKEIHVLYLFMILVLACPKRRAAASSTAARATIAVVTLVACLVVSY